ncbi:MAG: hypothetical protein AAFX01_00970 [Cyanobacteria bacterium J06638_28]
MVGKQIRSFLQALPIGLAKTPAAAPSEDLANVPSGILDDLSKQVKKLPVPQPYQVAIREAFTEALRAWQADPELEANSLVVLSQPDEAIAPILKASFQKDIPNCNLQYFLSGYQRPPDPLTILEHLQRELKPDAIDDSETLSASVTEADIQEDMPTVIVIPSLEQCFLRCIQGWEGIEYLQTFAAQDRSIFWVFGCNHWAWAFLEKVCQIDAYLEKAISLPKLSGEDLKTWLAVLVDTPLDISVADCPEVRVDEGKSEYWNVLTDQAEGSKMTAIRLWLQSLRIRSDDLAEEGAVMTDVDKVILQQTKPASLELMSLGVTDRYLLHSLLIHGEMTRSHLALSLGEAERTIRSRVQVLQREGIIIRQGRRLSIHPAYYPKLRSEMQNNNFLVGKR